MIRQSTVPYLSHFYLTVMGDSIPSIFMSESFDYHFLLIACWNFH